MDNPETVSEPVVTVATRLALERTRIAYERTFMAWVRTSTSLITFGFSVYKFFQLEYARDGLAVELLGSRGFSIVLIGSGLVCLVIGMVEHGRDLRALAAECRDPEPE